MFARLAQVHSFTIQVSRKSTARSTDVILALLALLLTLCFILVALWPLWFPGFYLRGWVPLLWLSFRGKAPILNSNSLAPAPSASANTTKDYPIIICLHLSFILHSLPFSTLPHSFARNVPATRSNPVTFCTAILDQKRALLLVALPIKASWIPYRWPKVSTNRFWLAASLLWFFIRWSK